MLASFIGSGIVRSLAAALFLVFLGGARAGEPGGLYSAVTIITGTLEAETRRGFAVCLEEVLVKVSSDTSLAGSPAVSALGGQAEELVERYSLRDRMAGIPVHDEQGTRERPHVLDVKFAPAKIDAALRALGRTPWTARPAVTLLVGVDNAARRFVLAEDSALGVDHREALSEIAGRLGLKVVLPDEAALAAGPLDHASLRAAQDARLEALRDLLGAEVVLNGMLSWDEKALRWTSRWWLVFDDGVQSWDSAGVSFDAVFRDALAKAMRALSSGSRE